jgi:hypothetical protein
VNNPVRVADLTGFDMLGPYFWKSEEQIVLLRHVPGPDPEEAGHFEALIHNLTTGRKEPLEAFNARFAPLLRGSIMYVSHAGQPGREITYSAPACSISP